jgi:hypothetical protein
VEKNKEDTENGIYLGSKKEQSQNELKQQAYQNYIE